MENMSIQCISAAIMFLQMSSIFSGGDYIYLGLKNGIVKTLSQIVCSVNELTGIELSFNIDGVPLYNSNKTSLWPIQGSITNMPFQKPFVVALFSSDQKPQSLDFLEEFVNELKELMENGIIIDDKQGVIPVSLRCFICDAPARALIKATVQYNGRYGCDFCDVQGISVGRMIFKNKGNPRTDSSFREKRNPGHHKGSTPLLRLPMDMIKQMPVDPMHCVDLGVVRKIIRYWKEGSFMSRLSATQINVISTYLKALRPFMPSDFNRKPRALQEYKMWKATELRSFLMYTGPVILKHVLPKRTYIHFLSLSIAMCILYNEELVRTLKMYGNELLEYFVKEAEVIYGETFLSYNVHCLQHLADFAEHYKCLQNCTAYEFENNMSAIKRSVRGPDKPIVQVYNRLTEKQQTSMTCYNATNKPVKSGMCYKMKTGKYCTVHNIQADNGKVLCEVYNRTQSFYTQPCDSRLIGIHKVSHKNSDMVYCDKDQLESSAIYVPLSLMEMDEPLTAVVIPLMHC